MRRKTNRSSDWNGSVDIWPGFVDALSTVLLVFIFVLVGFISSQMYLSGIIVDKDSTLQDLQSRIAEVCSLLDVEQNKTKNLKEENLTLLEQLNNLKNLFNQEEEKLKQERMDKISIIEKLNLLTKQMKDIAEALNAEKVRSEERERDFEHIKKENIKLNELGKFNAYRSEFFEKLRDIVKDKDRIKIAGDRFIFQSELFFDSASDTLSADGESQIAELAGVINEIGRKIPSNIKWILRVDGHTDNRPISARFKSNWELSTARAISVVKSLIKHGVHPEHLVAAGFGEYQPLSYGNSEEDFAKNRRIEFKLDSR